MANGGIRGNVSALSLARWKAINDNRTLSLDCGSTIEMTSKSALFVGVSYIAAKCLIK